jgi:hypothetical protein
MDPEQFAALKRQHEAWLRSSYDGHNRKGGKVTMSGLRVRKWRRQTRQWLTAMVQEWSEPAKKRRRKR